MPDNLKIEDREGKDWSITNIPNGLMDEFSKAAQEIYPDSKNPWMDFLLDTIASVCSTDKVVYQMTDIPYEAMEKFEQTLSDCKYDRFSIFAELLQDAAQNNFAVGRLHTKDSQPGSSVGLILTGIPLKAWEAMDKVAQEWAKAVPQLWKDNQPNAIGVIALFLELGTHQGLQFKFDPGVDAEVKPSNKDEPKRKSSNRRGSYTGTR